jgi:hypothetical protein
MAGLVSIGLAIIGGVLTAMTVTLPLAINRTLTDVTVRILLGLTIFVLVALVTGGLSAIGQNYSLGVGHYLR